MNDCAINIRILWWSYQVKFTGESLFKISPYWHERKLKSIVMPIGVYYFKPSKIKK